MVMAAGHDVETALCCNAASNFRIVMKREPPSSSLNSPQDTVMRYGRKTSSGPLGDEMLVTDIIAVDKMHGAAEGGQFVEHKRRDKITAVDHHVHAVRIAVRHRCAQVGNVVMTVGQDSYSHSIFPNVLRKKSLFVSDFSDTLKK